MSHKFRWLSGRHAVEETLRAAETAGPNAGGRSVKELWILDGSLGDHIRDLVHLAKKAGAKVRWVGQKDLDKVTSSAKHQGLAVMTGERVIEGFGGYLAGLDESKMKGLVLVACDQIQDPHNLGAIARSASCLGAGAILVPERRSAPVTSAVVQASAGAVERIPVFTIGNLASTLEKLKERHFWVYGADVSGKPCYEVKFNAPMVLVIGSEGYGMRPLVRERCDEIVSIPQAPGGVDSLNASCAASILLYEAFRQIKSGSGF